jgi:hypothetical protein
MAIIQIPNLPAVIGLDGSELFEGVQAGSSVKISLNQMIAATRSGLPTTLPIPVSLGGTGVTTSTGTGSVVLSASPALTGNVTVTSNSASAALAVTQTGAGNAFVVEDSTSPDSSPFVVNASGYVGIGTTVPSVELDVWGSGLIARLNSTTTAAWLRFDGSGTSFPYIGLLGGIGVFGNTDASPLAFNTNSLERYRIGSAGQLGIGGTNYGTSGQTIISAGSAAAPAWGAVGVAGGGTGITSYTIGNILYASGTTTLSALADVATGNALLSGGIGAAPTYGKIGLTTHVSGVLPVANGGTNVSSYTIGDILYASTTGVLSPLADVVTGNALISGGVGAAPSYGKIGLTTHVSGTLPVGNGGTGQASNLTQYGVVYGSTTTAMATTAAGTTTTVLHGNAAGAPTFGAVSLTADITGTLAVGNGGTGATTSTGTGSVVLSAAPTITNSLNVTGPANATVTSTGLGGYGSFDAKGSGTNSSYVFFSNVTNGEQFRLTSTDGGTLIFSNGAGANTRFVMGPLGQFGIGGTTYGTSGQALVSGGASAAPSWSSAGAFTTLSASSTVSGTGFSTYLASPPAIGGTAAAAGAFTTLSASSTVSGTGFSTYLASPPAIGGTAAAGGAFTSLTSTSGGINGTVGATTPSSGAFTTVTASTSVLSSGTGGIGYATGAGVAPAQQLTSRTTSFATTGNSKSGALTLFTAAPVVGTYFSFTVPNTGIAVTDTVVLSVRGATNTYVAFVSAITAATSFQVTMASVAGTASDTPIVNFTIIKGVSA